MSDIPFQEPKAGIFSRKFAGLRLSAVLETLGLLAFILLLDQGASGDRFFSMQPHPFWIPVLLVAAQYGLEEGLFAAFAASAALLIGNVPPMAPGEDIFASAMHLAFNPALWLIGALLVGGLSERHVRRAADLKRRADLADTEAEILRESVERLAQANESLENRVAGQLMTFAGLYEAAKAVERETPGEVLMGAARLVRSAMNAKEFSIFLLNEGALEAALCEGWPANTKKLRRITAGSPLFDHVVARRAVAHVALPAGELMLANQGVLAGPICNPASGVVRGMLKVERMSFEDFTPASVHNFKVLCDWLGAALTRAEDLQRARSSSLLAEDGTLLSRRMLSRIEDLLARLAKRESFPLAALDLDIFKTDASREILTRVIAGAASEALRGTDLAFESRDGAGCCVLLPGANEPEARAAATRLQLALEGRLAKARIDADIRVTVRVLAAGEDAHPITADSPTDIEAAILAAKEAGAALESGPKTKQGEHLVPIMVNPGKAVA